MITRGPQDRCHFLLFNNNNNKIDAIFISIFLKIYKHYFFVSNPHENIMNLPKLMVWERVDFIKWKFFILRDGLQIEYENCFCLIVLLVTSMGGQKGHNVYNWTRNLNRLCAMLNDYAQTYQPIVWLYAYFVIHHTWSLEYTRKRSKSNYYA